jgi:lambda family phage portal protein
MSRTVKIGRREITVPWTLADRLVEWANPTAGAQRLQSRIAMESATGSYNGGKKDRRPLRNFRPRQTSANEAISADLPDLRARSRDLVRNVPVATGAIETVTTSVVGDGLVLKASVDRDVLGLSPEAADAWQKQAEREFAVWADRPDFTSRLNFDEMQALALRSVLESGDLLVVRRRRFDLGDTYGLKLQFVEADRLSNPNGKSNSSSLVDGVELDPDGRPVAYHISTRHPDDIAASQRSWKRYEIFSNTTGNPLILHLYRQLRVDQARGVPYLAPVIEAIKQVGQYSEAEITAAVVSAMFTVFIETPNPEDENGNPIIGASGEGTSADEKTEVQLGNGAIQPLLPGEKANIPDPARPNPNFDGFVMAMSRHIGVALELPVELLLKSFQSSYSASRASLEMAWQMFRTRRTWLAWKFCQPVYEWVITEAVASGRLAAPGFFSDPIVRAAWLGSDWIGPARIQLDPQKEASADLIDLGMGTKTRAQIIMERTGGSFEQKHEQLVREQRMRDADGLVTPANASSALQPAQSGGEGANDGGGQPKEGQSQ